MRKTYLFVFCASLLVTTICAQEKAVEEKIRSIDINKIMEDGQESIKLKLVREDGSVYENEYESKEEMMKDPALVGIDFLEFGNGELVVEKDADEGKSVKMKRLRTGERGDASSFTFSTSGGETGIWNDKANEAGSYIVMRKGDDLYEIKGKDDDHRTYLKNGQEVDPEVFQEAGIHFQNFDNGTIRLSGGNFTFDSDEYGEGNIFVIAGSSEDFEGEEKAEHFEVEVHDNVELRDGKDIRHVTVTRVVLRITDELSEKEVLALKSNTGINLWEEKELPLENISYFPNPSSGSFNLRFAGAKAPTEISIIDMMGQEIYLEELGSFNGRYDKTIDLSDQNNGMYILRIRQGNQVKTSKIVIE